MAFSRTGALLAALVWALGGCATAPKAGSSAPALMALPLSTLEGRARSVGEVLGEGEATVFVFWAASCPCVRRYQARVEALRDAYQGSNVRFVGISSNADESPAQVKAALAERGARLEVLRDEGARLAQELKARSTPTVVLVRKDGQVLFSGWLDNERLPGEAGRVAYLEEAISAFLDGRTASSKSRTYGCTITRRLGEPPGACHAPENILGAQTGASP